MTSEDAPLALPETRDVRWWWSEGRADGVTEARSKDQFDRWLAARESEQRSRIAELEAVIEKARRQAEKAKRADNLSRWGEHGQHFQAADTLRILDTAPSTVLDQMIREAKAEALEWAAERLEGNPVGDPGTVLAQQDGAEFIRGLIGEVTD